MAIRDALLPEYDHEMAGARRALQAIPADNLQFRPHEKSWNIIELASHLARLQSWTTLTLDRDAIDVSGYVPEPPFGSVDDCIAEFDKNVAAGRDLLAATSDEQFMQQWALRDGEQTFFTVPRIGAVRSFILNHTIHHRGQLTVYIRMAGGKVPGLYGPSADDPGM